MMLRIAELIVAEDDHVRLPVSAEKIAAIAALSPRARGALPPILLYQAEDGLRVVDGFARIAAFHEAGCAFIQAEICASTMSREDAIWMALGKNEFALDEEVRYALEYAFLARPELSAVLIAPQVGCSHQVACRWRQRWQDRLGLPTMVYNALGHVRRANRPNVAAMKSSHRPVEQIPDEQLRPEDFPPMTVNTSKAATLRKRVLTQMATEGMLISQAAALVHATERSVREFCLTHGVVFPAEKVQGKVHRHNSNKIVEQMVIDAENFAADVGLIEFDKLDMSRIDGWVKSLLSSRRSYTAFVRQLEEMRHVDQASDDQARVG